MTSPVETNSGASWAQARIATGPRGNLLLGVLPEIRRDVLGFFRRLAEEHPDISRYRLGPMTSHMIIHPDGLKRVLQDNVANYTKEHVTYSMVKWIIPNGLLTSEGPFWLRQRRLAQPAFHRDRIAALADGMVRAAQEVADRWEVHARSGEPVSMTEEMTALTLRIAADSLFGVGVADKTERVSRAFTLINNQFVDRFRSMSILPPVLPSRADKAFRGAVSELRSVVDGIIVARRQSGEERDDLLSMLMNARDEETGEQMSDQQLRDEVLTMLIAGHETTATALSWIWTLLAQHPRVADRLAEELASVLGDRTPTMADLPRLPYCRSIIDETLRLFPPLYILSRKVKRDDVVLGHRIPGGTWIDICPYLTHRHPAFWDEPEAFRPERFCPEAAAARPRYAYLPFLGGPRQCIGNMFALVEVQLVLATLAQRFTVMPAAGAILETDPLATLRPKGALHMHPKLRDQVLRPQP